VKSTWDTKLCLSSSFAGPEFPSWQT
jgi:hypothetical protein